MESRYTYSVDYEIQIKSFFCRENRIQSEEIWSVGIGTVSACKNMSFTHSLNKIIDLKKHEKLSKYKEFLLIYCVLLPTLFIGWLLILLLVRFPSQPLL